MRVVDDVAGRFFEVIQIVVEILDVNDHRPHWSTSELSLDISESVLPGSAFRLPDAVDDDGVELGVRGYRLTSDADNNTGIPRPQPPPPPFDVVFEPR